MQLPVLLQRLDRHCLTRFKNVAELVHARRTVRHAAYGTGTECALPGSLSRPFDPTLLFVERKGDKTTKLGHVTASTKTDKTNTTCTGVTTLAYSGTFAGLKYLALFRMQ